MKKIYKNKLIIIAEIGVNHNGNLSIAKKLIDEAKKAGCDFVKFQSFKAENLVKKGTKIASYQKKNIKKNISQITMLKKFELSEKNHKDLHEYCKRKKILFLSSPFDIESLELLFKQKIYNIKIASGEITNYFLLRNIAKKAKKIFLSTGMATLNEIKNALKILEQNGINKKNIYVMHCHSDYPTNFKDVNLKAMNTIKDKLGVRVGYSDHTIGFEASISAVALGAQVIEKHITLNNKLFGPDHVASMPVKDLFYFVKCLRNTELLLGRAEKKPTKIEKKLKKLVRRSIVAKMKILKGEIFTEKNITSKRPENGISSIYWDKIIGKKSQRSYKKDDYIKY